MNKILKNDLRPQKRKDSYHSVLMIKSYRAWATVSRTVFARTDVTAPLCGSFDETSASWSTGCSSSTSSPLLLAMLCRTQAAITMSTVCGMVATSTYMSRWKRVFSRPKAPSMTTRCRQCAALKVSIHGCQLAPH